MSTNNTQLPVEYNPGICNHKRPNGFTAWQMQSELSGSGPDFDEHVTICVCVLCGDIKISGRKWDSESKQTNRFNETFHVYVPEAIDAIIKQANFYNEEAKWSRIDTAYATKLQEAEKENVELRRWKMEAAELLTKIHSYAHKHLEIKLGESIVDFVIARAKERDELQRQNEKMKAMATGWRTLLEEVLASDWDSMVFEQELKEKINKFLYGE